MKKYIGKRLLTVLPVLLMISIGAFIMINLAPGSPADLYMVPDATPEQIEATKRSLGLDQPVPIQYIRWLGKAVTGDLGHSFSTRYPVLPILVSRLVPTIVLMGTTLLVSYIIAIPLGIISARKQGTWIDTLLSGGAFIGVSIPNFFLGLGLIYIFSVQLGWFPTGGMSELGGESSILSVMHHIGVMNRGRLLEVSEADELYQAPLHPYTESLLSAIPTPDPESERSRMRTEYNADYHHYDDLDKVGLHEIAPNHSIYCHKDEITFYKKKRERLLKYRKNMHKTSD